MNNNCGENIGNPPKNIMEARSVINVTMTNEELINSFLLADLGRYLFKLEFSPRIVKLLNNVIMDMRVVAIPTFSGLYNRAMIIQKKNPNPPNINILTIVNSEFL